MDIKVGDYVNLKSWEEVKDGNNFGIGESTWNDLCKKPRKVLEIDDSPNCNPRLAYFIEDEVDDGGWFVLESSIASVRRDFK